MKVLSILMLCISACPVALGCMPPPQPPTHELFWPSQSPVQVDGKFPRLPAVVLEKVEFRRAIEGDARQCAEPVGSLRVNLRWPGNRVFPFAKMGFYFRVTSGNAPPGLFPREPVTLLKVAGDRAEVLFTWSEPSTVEQKPVSFTFEVIPVNAWLHLGPGTSRVVP